MLYSYHGGLFVSKAKHFGPLFNRKSGVPLQKSSRSPVHVTAALEIIVDLPSTDYTGHKVTSEQVLQLLQLQPASKIQLFRPSVIRNALPLKDIAITLDSRQLPDNYCIYCTLAHLSNITHFQYDLSCKFLLLMLQSVL